MCRALPSSSIHPASLPTSLSCGKDVLDLGTKEQKRYANIWVGRSSLPKLYLPE